MNLSMERIDFTELEEVRKKCLYFGAKGNQVMNRAKNLYRMEDITGNQVHGNLYVEVSGISSNRLYALYEDLETFCFFHTTISPDYTVDFLTEFISGFKFNKAQGLIDRLAQWESQGAFINLLEIEALNLLGRKDLASHYIEYRSNYLLKKKLIEEKEMKERRQREEEEDRKLQERIQSELAGVKKSFINKEDIINRILNLDESGKQNPTIILHLLRQYDIRVPLKTQGWINRALAKVCFNKDGVTYYYRKTSSDSTVFYSYLVELEKKILEEHQREEACK